MIILNFIKNSLRTLRTLGKWLWKNLIIEWFSKGIVGGIFQGIVSGIPVSVSKSMTTIIPIVILILLGFYFDKPIVNKAVKYEKLYIEKALNLSLETKIIHSLTELPFWSKILYDSLKKTSENQNTGEKNIDNEHENLQKSFKEWENDFNKNLQFIQNNVSENNIKERECFGKKEKISESECQLKQIKKIFNEKIFKKLDVCYNFYYKKKDSCFSSGNYTLADFNQNIIQIDKMIINFYKTFMKEQKN